MLLIQSKEVPFVYYMLGKFQISGGKELILKFFGDFLLSLQTDSLLNIWYEMVGIFPFWSFLASIRQEIAIFRFIKLSKDLF